MRKAGILLVSTIVILSVVAQDKLFIHKSDKTVLEYLISAIDHLYFSDSNSALNIQKTDNSIVATAVSTIDSLTFGAGTDTVTITYSGTSATVVNPLKGHGVEISQSGADIVVNSSLDQSAVTYILSGTATEGSFKIYSAYRLNLVLNAVNITNSDGPAINVQSSKKIGVSLAPGTTSSLTDGLSYATSTEDQKGTFFSEGQLLFSGSGTLNVKSFSKHAICSDDYIQVDGGTIVVTSSYKDGIHSKDNFRMTAGTLNLTTTGDGVECESGHINISGGNITTSSAGSDAKGLTADSTLTVSGGTINMTVSGLQGKGIKSKTAMTLTGGNITINTSGAAALTASGAGFDPSYCTAIKAGTSLSLAGSNITITSTGAGGKGISSDGTINMTAGTISITTSGAGATYTNISGVTDSYASACMDADGDISIMGGSFTGICSGSACKGVSTDKNLTIGDSSHSPTVTINNTGVKLLVSGTANYTSAVYSEPKNIKSDGVMNIGGGTFTLTSTQQGANTIDCDSLMTISGGTIGITLGGNQAKGIKSTRAMNLTGGTITVTATGGVTLEYTTTTSKLDPSYCASIKSDADINLAGATITINSSGAGGKGISSATNIIMTAGTVKVTNSGTGTTYVNSSGTTDSYSAAGLTCDGNITITGGSLTCTSSGSGGKGVTCDGAVTIGSTTSSPTVNLTTTGARFLVSGSDYCHSKTLVATGAIIVYNGTNTITSSDDGIHSETSLTLAGGVNTITASSSTTGVGEGIESKSITISGGTNTITASNDGINATEGTVVGGTESTDNSLLTISGGTTYVTGADAIDANGNMVMTGGIVFSNGPSSGVEEFCDVNGTAKISGGTFVGCSSSQMQKSSIFSSSSQYGVYITTTLSTSTLYTVAINGTTFISFKPKNGGGACYVSSPQMKSGAAYVVYTGGTYSGGSSANNLYLDGTLSTSSATSKKSGTLSSVVTTASF